MSGGVKATLENVGQASESGDISGESGGICVLHRAAIEATRLLLTAEDVESGVQRALDVLRAVLDVDRAYLFEYHGDSESGAELVSQRAGSCRNGEAHKHFENLSYVTEGLQELRSQLAAGKAVVGPVNELDGAGRSFLERHGIRSILMVPIIIGNRLWGGMAFDDSRTARSWSEDEQEILNSLAVSVGTVIERWRRERRVEILRELAREISGTLDLDEIFAQVTLRSATLLPCDRVAILHWDRELSVFRLVAQHGLPESLLEEAVAFEFRPPPESVERLATGRSELINEGVEQSRDVVGLMAKFGARSMIATPLAVHGRLLGALLAIRTGVDARFDARHIHLLELVASHVAPTLESAELYRLQQEDAQVSRALVRVGREIIGALNTPGLLHRLCQVTATVLNCDCSHTLLWDANAEIYRAVAGYGDTPEQWKGISERRTRKERIAELVEKLERDSVAELLASNAPELRQALGITSGLRIALRRGGELVGMQTASYRGRKCPLSRVQWRIARGIGHFASLAFENTRLVEEVHRANRLKSEFIATVSHELRTPLNVIIGYNDLLLDAAFGPVTGEQHDTLSRMNRSAWELLDLINATLDVSRLDSGDVPVDMREIIVSTFLAEVERETRDLRAKPGIEYSWHVQPELPAVNTDPVKLKVVLKNLISNAVKFTESGNVEVRVEREAGGVLFRVVDTGIGMASDTVDSIFEPFRQLDGSITRKYNGVGLGLYVVRRLLDLIGGRITVKSTPGRGSSFRVWLPRSLA